MKEFSCRKCGNHTFRRRGYKIKAKGMSDYRRKLSHQNPASFKKHDSKVVCKKCSHGQRI